MSASSDLVSVGLLVGGLVLLGSLERLLPAGLVGRSPLLPELLEGSCELAVPLFFLLESFGLGRHNLLSCHHHKIITNIYSPIKIILKNAASTPARLTALLPSQRRTLLPNLLLVCPLR